MVLPEWFDLDGRPAGLQELPIGAKFFAVNLGPSFDEPLLSLRQPASEAFNRVDGKHRGLLLLVRVEMRPMVRLAEFDEHPNHDAEEPRQFRHATTVASPVRVIVPQRYE
jgi:hypothetical protein